MPRVVGDISVSMDGYATGVGQTRERPFGDIDARILHDWAFHDDYALESSAEIAAIVDAGAFIMGRNMFGPDRGDWDLGWRGWWGADPPYHGPVFVLAHRPRPDLDMEGGTTFHFVTDGIHAALERARAAAGDRHVAIAGGARTLNQYLHAGLVDELRLHVTPTIVGSGERVFDGVGRQNWEIASVRQVTLATHVVYRPRR